MFVHLLKRIYISTVCVVTKHELELELRENELGFFAGQMNCN